jgi:hypothetical protein
VQWLESLDHPLVFIFTMTLCVVAMQKILAYLFGRMGLPVASALFNGGSAS